MSDALMRPRNGEKVNVEVQRGNVRERRDGLVIAVGVYTFLVSIEKGWSVRVDFRSDWRRV